MIVLISDVLLDKITQNIKEVTEEAKDPRAQPMSNFIRKLRASLKSETDIPLFFSFLSSEL